MVGRDRLRSRAAQVQGPRGGRRHRPRPRPAGGQAKGQGRARAGRALFIAQERGEHGRVQRRGWGATAAVVQAVADATAAAAGWGCPLRRRLHVLARVYVGSRVSRTAPSAKNGHNEYTRVTHPRRGHTRSARPQLYLCGSLSLSLGPRETRSTHQAYAPPPFTHPLSPHSATRALCEQSTHSPFPPLARAFFFLRCRPRRAGPPPPRRPATGCSPATTSRSCISPTLSVRGRERERGVA